LHVLQGDLIGAKPEHSPSSQSDFQVLLTHVPPHGPRALRVPLRGIDLASRQSARFQIGIEACRLAVSPIDPDATFHLNQAAGLQMGKIGPPTPLVVEAVFPLQGSPARGLPEHQEAILKARGRFGGTKSQAGHGLREESKHEAVHYTNSHNLTISLL